MKDALCAKCFCSDCELNALDYADGMCRNCEACLENAYEFRIARPEQCPMREVEE